MAAVIREILLQPPFLLPFFRTFMERFRSLPVKSSQLRVDRDQRVIYGVSAAQAVEALGHGVMLDEKSIDQLVTLGNASKRGVKSRFTHPGMSADGLGKYLGRLKDFRTEGDKAVADLHLSALASKAPTGDLSSYVMDMAEQEPDMFGMSVVIDMDRAWRMEDGSEKKVSGWDDERPKGALDKLPVARIKQFVACDAVDEPAANRDGIFSSALWATNQDAEQAFTQLDEVLQEWGVSPDKAYSVALKYFHARGVKIQAGPEPSRRESRKMEDKQDNTAEQLATLQRQMTELQEQLAATAAEKAEADARAAQVTAALDTSNERIAKMETDARHARFRALSAEWHGNPAGHVDLLEQLGEDSAAFRFYVQQQNAVAEQLKDSKLFEDIGSSRQPEGTTATERLTSAARQIASEEKVSFAQAVNLAAERNPQLYSEHVIAQRGK
jgi:hypothetical protein